MFLSRTSQCYLYLIYIANLVLVFVHCQFFLINFLICFFYDIEILRVKAIMGFFFTISFIDQY